MLIGIGEVYAVEDQEAAIASGPDAMWRADGTMPTRTGGTAPAPNQRGGSGTIQFGFDFTRVIAPWGSDGPPVQTQDPSGQRQQTQQQQGSWLVYAIGAAAVLFLIMRR